VITDVEVADYQSVKRASIRLGRFTVVTGPTGSGKSAVIRAIRLAAFNARGTSYIRNGAKVCKAGVGSREENCFAAIHRGARGSDKYVLGALGEDGRPVLAEEYTKLGGQVPPEVTGFLRLSELNFAGQFDRPYLLDATGGQVARVLGELTNVTIVFDAAREATRRKQESARALRRAEQELEDLKEQALRFRGLRERRDAALEARERLDGMDRTRDLIRRARSLAEAARAAGADLAAAERRLASLEVPSAAVVQGMAESLAVLRHLAEASRLERAEELRREALARVLQRDEELAHQELHAILVSAGTCPTCGQQVREA
jgi:DNA repair protein SbcC/Rad50